MTETRWKLSRAGLFNFWYYEYETFDFADGKLLLRGSNGSGKSVTMQSLITVLLDANTHPSRLDPFGTTARRMSDYLLGEKDVSKLDERTGYLFLEYEKPGQQQYLTTGIGLQAQRSKSGLGFWGFVVSGNVRIGEDFNVCKFQHSQAGNEREALPLSRRELESELAPFDGQIVTQRAEYKALVNKALFRFSHIEAYDDLIKLLVQLRSPKLSKAFKPSVIYDILHEALTPLSQDELRPLSETIDYINQARAQLDQLKSDRKAMLGIRRAYNPYNQCLLLEKARGFDAMYQIACKRQEELEDARALAEQHQRELQELDQQLRELEREQRVVEANYDQWKDHDVFRAEKRHKQLQQNRVETERKQRVLHQEIQRKQKRYQETQERIQAEQHKVDQQQQEMHALFDVLAQYAEAASFTDHESEHSNLAQQPTQNFAFDLWQQAAQAHHKRLTQVQQLLRDVDRQQERFEDAREQMDTCNIQLEDARELESQRRDSFEQLKTLACEQFEHWLKRHQALLELEPQEIAATKQAFLNLYASSWRQVLDPSEQAIQRALAKLTQREAQLDHRIQQQQNEQRTLNEELHTWRNKREPEPPRHRETELARQQLKDRGVPFQPLYALVDFADHLDSKNKERIEAALLKMDILDALVLPNNEHVNQNIKSDRILVPQPLSGQSTLASVLKPAPVEGFDTTSIQAILQSIAYDHQIEAQNPTAIFSDGRYHIGPLRGHAPSEQAAVFIGKQAREQFRQRRIQELESQIEELAVVIADLQQERAFCQESKQQLIDTRASFPAEQPLVEGNRALNAAILERESAEKQAAKASDQYRKALDRLRELKQQCESLAKDFHIERTLTAFSNAVESMNNYLSELSRLQREHQTLRQALQMQQTFAQQREELDLDLQNSRSASAELSETLAETQLELQEVAQQLQDMDAADVRAKLKQLAERKEAIPRQILQKTKKHVSLSDSLANFKAQHQKLEADASNSLSLYFAWQRVFKSELELRIVRDFKYEQLPQTIWQASLNQTLDQQDPLLAAARKVMQELTNKSDTRDRNSYYKSLNDAFYQNRSDLLEYDPQLIKHAFQALDLPNFSNDPTWSYEAQKLKETAERENVRLLYNGRRLDLYAAIQAAEANIAEQELTLTEKDRELYQEVILNNIGSFITNRIHETKHWVVKMNDLMRKRNISSGIVFSLEWKARPADQESELDTEELVLLLTKDRQLLSDTDLDRLIAHFQTRLERARSLAEEGSTAFFEEVRQVLDYRDWFTFKLHYRKPDKPKRELTDRAFGQFSGGEKAMAMYIPLFSAAYSRYDAAGADAPRIISLDEAFAGVDENNIREMFDLMEQLDFDYIINSQALWGEYDTVSNLAIVELLRPKDANLVTPVRFRWNGKRLIEEPEAENQSQFTLFEEQEA